jgi:hypothetical protein
MTCYKGELISKVLFGTLNSSKNERKNFYLRYSMYCKVEIFRFFVRFLEELKTPKSPFEIN